MLPMDTPGVPPTLPGRMAQINGPLHVLALAVGALLVSKSFMRDAVQRSGHPTGLALSTAMVILFFATAATLAANVGIVELAQRVFIVTATTWFALTAARLAQSSGG